jgi:radical SAM protein with 4Fe4S-binding SPASM domain
MENAHPFRAEAPPRLLDFWDQITEHEIDDAWRRDLGPAYREYRARFEAAKRREYVGPFPVNMEIEASYHCNLRCPFCPRFVGEGERALGHMSEALWRKILGEARDHALPSLMMDHEAESLMNPRFFQMLGEARDAGILDLWLSTNGMLLTPERAARLIDGGLTKLNVSIDAATPETHAKLRVGARLPQVVENVRAFLRLKQEKGAHHLRTRISFVEQRENLGEKRAFFDFWRREPGVNMITFQECTDFSPFEKPDADAHLGERELEDKYGGDEPFHCSVPWEMPVIDTQGNVMPCGRPVREHTRDFVLGNLEAGDTIASCWTGEKMQALRALHARGEWYKNPMCRVCVTSARRSKRELLKLRAEAAQRLRPEAAEPSGAGR